MVDQQFCVLAEKFVKQVLIFHRASGNIAHRKHSVFFELLCIASTDSPKVCERLVRPKLTAKLHLIQLCNANTVFICRNVLCHNIHRNFAEKKVCSNPGGCGDTGCLKHIQDHLHRKVMWREMIGVQIIRHIHKHLVDGVNHNVFRRNILHVDLIYPRTDLHVPSHLRRCDDEVNRKLRISLQLRKEMR